MNFHRVAFGAGLWETVGMNDRTKLLIIKRDSKGNPVSGHCSKCGRLFYFIDTEKSKRNDYSFAGHECKREDASQAAARIVREATEE